jgi:adenylate dimethylallyltransferase (cytokinin synthase)
MAPTAPALPRPIKMLAIELPDAAHQDRSDQVPPPLSVAGRRAVAPPKHKAVVVLGATGTGKSRLAIDLARRFGGEVINSDKMQVYAGLDVATNKVSADECAGVPHHLLGVLPHPDAEFTAADFRREASCAVAAVAERGRVPIVAGGSNSYVEELVDGDRQAFRERYELCFLWVDARLPVLRGFVSRRVEDMLRRGLVEEVAAVFDPRRANYSAGVWRAIGVPELDEYLRASTAGDERERLLARAVEEIKDNTFRLACRQRDKIQRLASMWPRVHCVDATEVFLNRGRDADEAWQRLVAEPSIDAVGAFLQEDQAEYSSRMVKDSPVIVTALGRRRRGTNGRLINIPTHEHTVTSTKPIMTRASRLTSTECHPALCCCQALDDRTETEPGRIADSVVGVKFLAARLQIHGFAVLSQFYKSVPLSDINSKEIVVKKAV